MTLKDTRGGKGAEQGVEMGRKWGKKGAVMGRKRGGNGAGKGREMGVAHQLLGSLASICVSSEAYWDFIAPACGSRITRESKESVNYEGKQKNR